MIGSLPGLSDEQFRAIARDWLRQHVTGDFAELRGRGGPGDEDRCQGYSEPDAGSDLANVQTRARLDGGQWVIDGQKVWTSLAHVSHWCFVLARSVLGSQRHAGLTLLLVPMDQSGIDVRPIVQLTGGGEFNEVFFTEARTDADMAVGAPGDGWRVAMGLLGFERGISTLAQQIGFERELRHAIHLAREHGRLDEPPVRQRLMRAHTGLQLMRWNALRSMGAGVPGPQARADTIYGGSNEIQRNVIGERVLGLPR